ncbi:MAG TPA: glycosyltransferase [Lutibacter sp.]|nr:glycosyltransferase [Lutibacter sp.]
MKKKLNILFLSSWYPSRVMPTNGNFVQRHAEAITKHHNVVVVYPIGDDTKTEHNYEVIKETNKGVKSIVVYFKTHSFFLINTYRKLKAFKKGMSSVDGFDIIHANVLLPIGVLALLLKLKYAKPIIFTEHWTGYFHPKKSNLHFFKRFLLKLIASKSTFVVPVSNSLKEAMIKVGVKANYNVIGNAIDTNLFCVKEKTNSIYKILHISTLDNKHKNIVGLLEVIKQISNKRNDFVFQIIGDKNLQKTKELVERMEIPLKLIDFQGTQTPKQIAKHMQEANLYVSFSNYETFGVVYIEALATGTPVISTDTGILMEFELNDSYKITPIKDKEKLQFHIESYIEGNYKINTDIMREFAVKHFSYDAIAEQYSKLYFKALNDA